MTVERVNDSCRGSYKRPARGVGTAYGLLLRPAMQAQRALTEAISGKKKTTIAVLLTLLSATGSGCEESHERAMGAADGGARDSATKRLRDDADGGAPDSDQDRPRGDADGGIAISCNPSISHEVEWKDPDPDASHLGQRFVWAGDHMVSVVTLEHEKGARILEMVPGGDGAIRAATLWLDSGDGGPGTKRVAAAGNTLAIVDHISLPFSGDGPQLSYCRVGLARLGTTIESVKSPEPFTDLPAEGSPQDVLTCLVTTLADGFLLAWEERATSESEKGGIFAQRIGPEGDARGERLSLAKIGADSRLQSVVSDGQRAIAVLRAQDGWSLAVVDADSAAVRRVDLDLRSESYRLTLKAAHDGFVAWDSESIWLLDRDFVVTHGPLPNADGSRFDVRGERFVGPLGDGYVTVQREQYLVARTLDSTLSSPSQPLGLSLQREAYDVGLFGDADGNTAVFAYEDESGSKLAFLACSDEAPGPVGAQQCATQPSVDTLDPECTDEVCHVVMRFDYQTLGLLGWTVVSGPKRDVTETDARELARAEFKDLSNGFSVSEERMFRGPEAGVYRAYFFPGGETRGFVLIGAQSGATLASGSMTYTFAGRIWSPASWTSANDIVCGNTAIETESSVFDGELAACARETNGALRDALRSNIAAGLAKRGALDAYEFVYTPTESDCGGDLAEYIVVLTSVRD
jgi:hypothetical protein